MKPDKKEFAEELLDLLQNKQACYRCPAPGGFVSCHVHTVAYGLNICRRFFGSYGRIGFRSPHACPCFKLGPDKAAKMGWLWLEAEGYLDKEEEECSAS